MFEITFPADAKQKDWAKIGYSISVQRDSDLIEALYARRIFNFQGEFVLSGSSSTTLPTLERAHIAGTVAR
jgi:hypothetical protein